MFPSVEMRWLNVRCMSSKNDVDGVNETHLLVLILFVIVVLDILNMIAC